jgi:mono/diheme cytochrome c family protein
MLRINWIHYLVAAILAVVVLLAIRMHFAAGQGVRSDATEGRYYAQAWCTECHSVEPETAGTGKFAPDFTTIAKGRTAHWLNVYLRSEHEIMPDFVFKTQEIDAIVTYIVSLKRR